MRIADARIEDPSIRIPHLRTLGLADFKGADVGAAAVRVFPGFVEALAGEAVLDGDSRPGLDAARQRRIEVRFAAAALVVLVIDAAGLDVGGAGRQAGAAAAVAFADGQLDRGRLDGDDVAEQIAALLLGQAE